MKWVKLIFNPVGWIIVGCVLLILGVALMWDGYANGLPERSELVIVEGVVREVARMSNRRPGAPPNVRYELDMLPPFKLVLTEEYMEKMHITKADVYALSGQTVEALIAPKKNFEFWEFTANGKKLLNYGPDQEAAAKRSKTEASIGTRCTGIGLLIIIFAGIAARIRHWYRSSRRNRKP